MERAYNPTTGEVLFQVNGQWVPPSQTAKNPQTGEMAYEVNGQWEVVPSFKLEKPEPMPAPEFGAEDIKKAQQQLREEPIVGIPRRQPTAPVVAPPAPPVPVEGLGALMANVPKQAALPSSTLPITPDERRRINEMWSGATPEQRKVLEAKPGYVGFLSRELASRYPTEVPKGVLAELDTRREAKEILKARQEPPQKPSTEGEFVKGVKGATNSLKMLPTTFGLQADANVFGRATNELTGFDQIDRGEITNIDQASKRLADTTLAYKYLNATPEERQEMRAQRANEIKDSQVSLQQAMQLYQKFQQDNQKYRGKTQDLTDVNTVKDFGNWLAYNFGSGAVQLAPVMLAAVATGGTGAFLTGTALAGQETIGNRLEFLQDKVKDLPPQKQADAIIDYLAKSGDTTTLVSLASGALDLAGPAGTVIRKRFEKEGLKSLVKSLEKETAIKAAKQAPREIAEEAITGGAQEATQIAGKRALEEQTGDILSKENIKAVINAAAAEGVGGAAGSAFNVGRAGLQQLRGQTLEFEPVERAEPSVGNFVPTRRKEPTLDNIVDEALAPVTEITAPPGLVEESEIEQPSIKTALEGAAKGMTENLYQGIFEAQQKGETKVSGIDEPVLIAAKEAGITFKTPEEVQAFANDPKVQSRLKEINIEQQVQRMWSNGQTVGQIQQRLPNVDVMGILSKGKPKEETKQPEAPVTELVDKFPMGDNVEYHIVKTPNGYVANMFDVDSENYIPGSARIFSTKNFGDQAEAKAREFAQGEVNKVKPAELTQTEELAAEDAKYAAKEAAEEERRADARGMGVQHADIAFDQRNTYESLQEAIDDYRQNLIDTLGEQGKGDYTDVALKAFDEAVTKQFKTTPAEQVKTPEAPVATPEGAPIEPLTEDDFKKMFKELVEEGQVSEQKLEEDFKNIAEGKPVTPVTPREEQTVPQLLGSAAKKTVSGMDQAAEGLSKLFGGKSTLGSGPVFDEETYAQAKPFFLQALSDFKDALADLRAIMRKLIEKVKAQAGPETVAKMEPYIVRFMMDVQSGAVKIEAPTEQAEEAKPNLLTPEGKFQVAQELADYLIGDGSFKTIVEARQKIAEITGQKIEPGTELAKQADETVETAIVLAARDIVKAGRKRGNNVTYDRLVGLLNRQPNLATRSSESIRDQAYSTPVPLAYLASELAGVTPESTVLEPTAGNGMLLIGASVNKAVANELNPTRAAMMRALGFTVTTQNAATSELTKPKSQDVVIANPPFGSTKDANGKTISFTVKDGYTTNEIDHAIVFKSLEAMKDDGRAVLIVGGVLPTTEEGRTDAYRGAAKRSFYYNLYNQYNVVDHFTVAGDLYAKQGASYPVDVIVIEGRGESERSLPAADLPQIYNSWDELKEKLNGRVVPTRNERPAGAPSGENQAGAGNGEGVAGGARGPSTGTGGEGGTKGVTPSEQGAGPAGGRPGGRGTEPSTRKLEPTGVPEGVGTGEKPVPSEGGVQPGSTKGTTGNKPTGVGGPSGSTGERVGSKLTDRRGAETETATQVEYVPRSGASSVGTLSPVAMQQATQEALDRIIEQHGDIDNYVAEALEMDPETLKENFSAEQIDALALAINNAEQGKGFIIGDQTGIGKGRVVAAMIKYALVNDKIPIFVTEKSNLYADMIRDLDDIGMTDELGLDKNKTKIFMTNNKEPIPYTFVRDVNGNRVETNYILKAPAADAALNALLLKMQQDNSLGEYKVIFTTYTQLQNQKGRITERQRFVDHFAAGNYIILDESHNAGGSGEAKRKKGKEENEVSGRAGFVRGLVQKSFGSFFSSATYAKRPDVMSLYSSTNMSLAVDTPSQLGEAIKNGGVPMQQAVATMLTKDGQYIRRERTFAGVAYDTVPAEVNKETAENMASAMRSVLAFSRAKETVVKEIQKDLDKKGEVAGQKGEKSEVQSANFGSTMHNLIDQMLLALKVDQAVKQTIELLKAGEKPVLTVSNTMGSFIKDYAEEMGIRNGDPVPLSFKDMYLRYLRKQRIIKIKGPKGRDGNPVITEHYLTDAELGPTLTEAYNRIADQIEKAGFGSAPISPIDYIKSELQKVKITDLEGKERNVKVDEITGRTVVLNYADNTATLGSRSADIKGRLNAVKGFNDGTVDVLILNQAGSTGLSLHASQDIKVKDKRKRHMILVQAEKNIDTHMQMLGRVHRTGQVVTPSYSQMMADIPAEMRPASVLMKKMASLNANTTASRKSAVTAEGVVDFMNDYGGQVAQEFLRDNPEIHNKLGGSKVLPLDEDPSEDADEGDIRKLTGYIPILPIEEQEKIYADLVARYNELIALEDSLGTNKLEAKAMDLDAKILSVEPVTEQKEELSLFAAPAIMERIDVKRTVKPYSSEEVNQIVQERLNGEQPAAIAREQDKDMRERAREYYREVTNKLQSQEKPDPVKIQAAQDVITGFVNRTSTILQTYKIGTQLSITDKIGQRLYGVVTNITNSKRTENPAAGSDWKMHIAVSNGESKTLTLSFSQIGPKYELAAESTVNWYNPETQKGEDIPLMQTFDKGATVRREKRWIVTGNLLAGFAKFPGQIISYTKDDGTTGQGILMSRQFDFEKVKENAPVEFKNPREIMEFLNSKDTSQVGTPDRHLTIHKYRSSYVFSASSPKRTGGQYHQDKNLTDIIGNFYGRGQVLKAEIWQEDKFIEAINYLNQKGVQLIATGNQKGARAAREQKLKGSAPSGSLSANAQTMYMSGRRSSTKMKKADIDKMVQPIRERGQVPEIVVVQGIDSLPEKILNEMRASGMELAPGLFHQDSNRIFLIADNIAHPQALWMTVSHELVGHYGLRAVLGDDYSPMMNAIYDGSEEVRKNVDDRLQRNRDQVKNQNLWMTKEEAVEEYVAEKAEYDPKLKWVNRLVNAIKGFLRKIGFTIPVGDSEVIRLIRDANKYTYGDAAKASWTVAQASKGREKGFARGAARYRQDDEDLVDKYNRPNVPMLQANPMRDAIIDAAKTTKELFMDAVKAPKWALDKAFTKAENTVLYLRNKNIWFGAGLNARDFERYKGALEDSQGLAIASVALDNAISSGNIGVQVVMQGGLKFDATHKRFIATETPLGMVGVYKAQADLKKKLGDQLGENIIQGYLEAKRSKSIKDEYAVREQDYKDAVDAYNRSLQQTDPAIQLQAKEAVDEAAADLASIKVALDKVNMSDEEIQEFIARDQEHPELRQIMDNWTSVNQNLLKVWKQVGLLSDKRYDVLSQIPDYVPWYRIMSENEDVHSPIQSTTKTLQNIGREKVFKEGKSKIVSVFTAEAGQQTFEIQPSAQVSVKVNGKRIPESKVSFTPDGAVNLNIVIKAGDQVVITGNREIENIIDNMTQNVMRMTMNAVRQYAASRIVKEYGTRNAKGQIMQFKSVDPKEGTFYFVSKGKRIIVQVQDPLVAEAVLGMSSLDVEMFRPLSLVANLTRRLITVSPTFQLKQIFQDAPTAALISGVKNPAAVMGGVFNGFVQSLRPSDPITEILRSSGIGGFYSPARTPEAEVKRRIGVLNNNVYDYVMRGLDHWGDASDMAQRRAVYIRVLKETGDPNLALYQAANVINFLHRGSGRVAQALTKTVPFMAAYANQIDVLAQTLIGGGLKGVSRGRALARLAKTGMLLSGITLLYCFLVGDDDDYIKLDDQARIRNFILPGTNFVIPMNTAAGFFFKAIPEMLYNTVVKHGTDKEIDGRRLRTALKEAAVDMLLGPTPLPSVVKTGIEIKLNKDFWSGREITPKRLENVKPEEQYTAATSEAGKILSKLSGGALNPMEMDHIVRSTFGSAGALAQYFTNLIGESQGVRAETPLKQTPLIGPFVRPEVPRGPEDLFYDLKKEVDTSYNTFKIKLDRMKDESAEKFEEENEDLISLHKIVNKTDATLQKINKEIRQTGESADKDMTPKEKREEMVDLMKEKNEVLDDIEMLRKEAGFSKDSIIHEILNRVSR